MYTVQSILDDHLAKLVAVGDKDQLALHFQDQKIKAECKSSSRCAIAVSFQEVLQRAFPHQPIHVWVSWADVMVDVGGVNAVALTPFGEFITKFDAGFYPELVA